MKKKNLLYLPLIFALCGCSNKPVNPSSSASSIDSVSSSESSISSTESSVSSSESSSSFTSKEEVYDDNQVLYVAPDIIDYLATGTKEDPMSIDNAIAKSKPGCTIILLNGTYKYSTNIMISPEKEEYPATAAHPKVFKAETKFGAKFDFSKMRFDSANRGLSFNSNYWTVDGLEVFGAGDNGIYIGGSHNTIQNCKIHDCSDTGLQLGRAASYLNSIDKWPSYNLIKNVTSYDNHDPSGEDSDGFACKLTTGVGNVFDGCIAYNNIDDGWDLYTKGDSGPISAVEIRNCIAFNNGRTTFGVGTPNSDGNGFKLGGELISVSHKVYNCIAFNNAATGFTDNSNPGPIYIENCTSYNNGDRDTDAPNIDMCRDTDTSINYYKNILSLCDYNYSPYDSLETTTFKTFNSKDQYKGTAVNSVFYYGRSLLVQKGVQECDYTSNSLRGEILKNYTNKAFVDSTIPDYTLDIDDLFRDDDGNIHLGDFLKVNPDFVKEIFGVDNAFYFGADLA